MAKRKSKLRRLAAKVAEFNAHAKAVTVERNIADIRAQNQTVAHIDREVRKDMAKMGTRLTPAPSIHPALYRAPRELRDPQSVGRAATLTTPQKGKVVARKQSRKFVPDRGQTKAHSRTVAPHFDRRSGVEVKHGKWEGESDAAMRWKIDPTDKD